MRAETDNSLSSCSIFFGLPEKEHLRGKIGEGDFESLRAVLNPNADVFSKNRADIGCCNFVEHEI